MSFLDVYFQSMKLRLVFHKSSINKTKKKQSALPDSVLAQYI
jgi:hypothetical protein